MKSSDGRTALHPNRCLDHIQGLTEWPHKPLAPLTQMTQAMSSRLFRKSMRAEPEHVLSSEHQEHWVVAAGPLVIEGVGAQYLDQCMSTKSLRRCPQQ